MKSYIFYHCYCINDYFSRFQSTYQKICESGLIDSISQIYIVAVGPGKAVFKTMVEQLPKVICTLGEHAYSESDTLHLLWDKSQNEEFNALYLHSKGVTKIGNEHVQSWIDYMEHFCITKYQDCLKVLESNDTCGVNLRKDPMLHYSGNFWWTKSSYLRTLERYDCHKSSGVKDERLYCEFWLLDNPKAIPFTLHQNDLDFYYQSYPREKYMEPFNIQIIKRDWEKKLLEVDSAWKGLELYLPSILESFQVKPNCALEFGVDTGYSTFILSQLFGKVTGVDTFTSDVHTGHNQGEQFYQVIKDRFKNTNVAIVRMDFHDFIKNCDCKYDLIHIDIVHTYKETFDCAEWAIRHSNVVILHDTCSYPEINKVCEDLSVKYGTGFYNIQEYYGLGIVFR